MRASQIEHERLKNRTQVIPLWVLHILDFRVWPFSNWVFQHQAATSRLSPNRGPGVHNTGVSSSFADRRHECVDTLGTHSVDESRRTTVQTEILFDLTLLACQNTLCCGVIHMFMPLCPRGHKGLSISTVRLPADECAVRLSSGCFRLEVIAIGTLCERLPHLLTLLVRHLRIPAIL